ncbi:hypothetical protein Q9Q94_17710 [Uliginosibacterium sp. 31-16]|uniref:hypothetical protein n=1 Tax=Uliginosibacterium sp. 31-16 TaxID=3068315 RepID=UPI00273DF710|nr:hypothetical protein [Uliginosibacterium sp. 31-16]MDP5241375.1 hypothetical protein [Uliginosibacterium sp. 31-16]
MGWLILVAIIGVMGYFLLRAWRVWQERFANRHEFDADHLALLMAQREEIEQPAAAPAPLPQARSPRPAHKTVRTAPMAADLQTPHRPPAPANDFHHGRRKPLLDAAAQEVFLRLQTDMPGFPVMAGVDIATLLDPHAPPPPRVPADFVLCKKDFTPAVVIFIERQHADPMLDRAETLLRQHRLRVLRWRADALPKREDMRHQIFKPKSA